MPEINSYADIIRDWEQLLTSAKANAETLPSIETHRLALETHLEATKGTKARQDSHTALRQQATQDLKAMVALGRELAIRLRGAVRADVGPKSELLVQFGMAPLRPRTRRSPAAPTTPEPPPDPAGAPKPAA